MAGAAGCPHASSGAPILQGKREFENGRWQRGTCGTSRGDKSCRVVMRSSWLGDEDRRWQLESSMGRRSRGGRGKGAGGPKQAGVRAGLEEILHNQVFVSSSAAGVLGQLAKPIFVAVRGKGFNWRLIYTAGGMPSTHSAVVTAAATALCMERGFADSVFGLALIYSFLIMYDAQGVRRSVGKQAEVINTMVFSYMAESVSSEFPSTAKSAPNPSPYAIGVELARDPVQAELAFMEDSDASTRESSKSTAVLSKESSVGESGTSSTPAVVTEEKIRSNGAISGSQVFVENGENLPSLKEGEVILQEIGNSNGWRNIPLKESVGHTKKEVFVGAIWGILIATALHSSIQ